VLNFWSWLELQSSWVKFIAWHISSLSLVCCSHLSTQTVLSCTLAPDPMVPWYALYSLFWLSLWNCIINVPHARTQLSYLKLSASQYCWQNPILWPTQISALEESWQSLQTPAFLVSSFDSSTEERFLYTPNPRRRRRFFAYDSSASIPNTGP